jgi:predicted S18 family serine protease
MNLNQTSTGPDLSDLPANFSTMYYGSQYFTPQYGASVHKIATYEYNDKAGMIACKYGNGTVFLSSPHPEYEENGDRDDTSFYDYLDDPDSEWDLLFRVSKWLIEASYVEPSDSTTPTNTTTTTTNTTNTLDMPLIAIALTGGAIVALTLAVLYRRRH